MSGNFDRLDVRIQKWIWQKQWNELRDIQDRAIPVVLDTTNDILISASTASGKTEAAFLPVLTAVVSRQKSGFSVLYLSPLKALINDQFSRLEELCETMEIDVVRWHGDAPQAGKDRAIKRPSGIALITPESIEALLVRRPATAAKLFQSVDFVIIDELHYFLEGARGLHLSVLLNRLDGISDRRARRIGLSATLGDIPYACRYLNWQAPETVSFLKSEADASELLAQIKGYVEEDNVESSDGMEEDGEGKIALDRIADDVFRFSKGSNNLIFAGSRRRVESLTDRLRTRCEKAMMPNEFFAHHGSLSKELRQDLEKRLKDGNLPTSAVATTSLELGIDIGSIKSVFEIGAPSAMSSLRQRVGRSGRREGVPAVLRIFVREKRLNATSNPLLRLRMNTVRSIAAIRLLTERYIEPPRESLASATVVLQQTLSIITERGGERAQKLFETVCSIGPLSTFPKEDYIALLRHMAGNSIKLLEQSPTGQIMLGELGERLVNKRDFYAMFETQDEWRIVSGNDTLGTVPLSNTLGVGGLIAFAGKRWRIVHVDDASKVLMVEAHRKAKIPPFESPSNENISDRMVQEMRKVLQGNEVITYLDKASVDLLKEARLAYHELNLDHVALLRHRDDFSLFFWTGTTVNELLALAFRTSGLSAEPTPFGITVVSASEEEVLSTIGTLARTGIVIGDMSASIESLIVAKWDQYVPEQVLRNLWGRVHAPFVPDVNYAMVDMAYKLGIDIHAAWSVGPEVSSK